jgi:hypothetical protein
MPTTLNLRRDNPMSYSTMQHKPHSNPVAGLRAAAVLEAAKGIIVLLLGFSPSANLFSGRLRLSICTEARIQRISSS